MLRKLLMTAGVGALVAMAIGGGSFASASGDDNGGRTIVLIEKTTAETFLDLGKHGPTAGDMFFFASRLWNADRTHRVGSNHGYCVVETPPAAHCSGTVRLGGGTLEYAFQLDTSSQRPPTPAIVGGTGAFDGAEGHATIQNLNAAGTLTRDRIVLLG